jgi:flagellar basal body-associated protein FliL
MEWAALIAWVVTAAGGFVLLTIWLSRGGMRQAREAGARIRPPLILSHFLLAATGLVVWIIYIATDSDALAWVALVLLAVVALLGFTMFAIWYQRRQRGPAAATGVTGSPGSSDTPPEQHFPVPIVGLHGLLAVTTVALVFLTAIGVGD